MNTITREDVLANFASLEDVEDYLKDYENAVIAYAILIHFRKNKDAVDKVYVTALLPAFELAGIKAYNLFGNGTYITTIIKAVK